MLLQIKDSQKIRAGMERKLLLVVTEFFEVMIVNFGNM